MGLSWRRTTCPSPAASTALARRRRRPPGRCPGAGWMTVRWLAGLVARRRGRLLAAALGIAVAVALIASIGMFLAGSTAAMTDRALARVLLDWLSRPPAPSLAALLTRCAPFPGVRTAPPVRYAQTTGFQASAHGSTTSASAGLSWSPRRLPSGVPRRAAPVHRLPFGRPDRPADGGEPRRRRRPHLRRTRRDAPRPRTRRRIIDFSAPEHSCHRSEPRRPRRPPRSPTTS